MPPRKYIARYNAGRGGGEENSRPESSSRRRCWLPGESEVNAESSRHRILETTDVTAIIRARDTRRSGAADAETRGGKLNKRGKSTRHGISELSFNPEVHFYESRFLCIH